MSWRSTTLGSAADILAGFPFTSENYQESPVGVRLLLGANVAPERPDWGKVAFWPAALDVGLDRYRLAPGDVILAMDRPWIPAGLKCFSVRDHDLPALLVQRVARLRAKPGFDQRFLYFVLRSQEFVDYIRGVETGSAVPHISGGQIAGFSFDAPDIDEQRAIAEVLGALDDKVELNRQMNHTLEEMASALLK